MMEDITPGTDEEVLTLPTNSQEAIDTLLKLLKEDKLTDKEEKAIILAISGRAATLKDVDMQGYKEDTLSMVSHNEIPITEKSDGIATMMSDLSLGVMETVKLIHSGFSITLKPITDDHFISLDSRLALELINLGRETNGVIYSNVSVGLVKLIVDFIIPNIYKSNLKLEAKDNIIDYIKIQDLQTLVLGIINSRYTNGISITKGCVNTTIIENGTPKCDEIITATLDSSKLLYTDNDMITDNMMEFNARTNVTVKEVLAYQNEVEANKSEKYEIDIDGKILKITLKTPSIKEYIENGTYWISRVVKKTEKMLGEKITEDAKNDMININAKQLYLGTYLHMFESIETPNSVITSTVDLNRGLNTLSANNIAYEGILKAIDEYKNKINITTIGLPTYTCSNCGGEQNELDVIPLDIIKTFFDLVSLATIKVMER